ncbi:SusC/RagA family TonB-linked outer membrane protein [Mucilaginibacter achroorhodeus]|uniref:SusC/RagA family TonB-linked outer membrane protein n=1 Tax=Mucilaginibacter achroorhodeus TaxID=2599294 RepID=A0A563U1X6_9SPHI|nr:SusC/RagA family TonB-linked outer membrane protein [Mucilaginibacter achroorhodeus]TWR24941.1 SusC/RagA family TonB-linked outer membrane protein [Mucilaginibacter achroorhodeus]
MKQIYQHFFDDGKIYQKRFLLLLCAFIISVLPAMSQTGRTIRGTVTDETREPLPGVSVVVVGTNTGVITDAKGNYALNVSGANATIRFSFIGYLPKDVIVGASTTINANLVPDAKQLKDVVVIGYGTASKKDVTGAITTLKSEEFNVGATTTPAELLQGKVAGLNITKSGDPNAAPSVVLRGPSTIRSTGGAQEPFYVIDGVPGASIDVLAPSDIETIDVLKDASSTAIYGSRAANGVIIITTKKSKSGQSHLNYSGYATVQEVSKKINMLTGDELRKYLADNGVAPLAKPLDDDGSNTNWQNLVERNGYSQNHNLSYNGASNSADYGASVNYFKNEGVLKRTALERTIYRGYVNQRFFDNRLRLNLNLTNSNTNSDDIYQVNVLPAMLFYLPTVGPFNPDGSYKENYTRTGSGTLNPLSLLDNNTIKINDNKTLINGIVSVDIIRGLKFTLSGSQQRDQYNYNSYLNSKSGLAVNLNGVARRSAILNTNNIIESYFNYDREFGRHSLKLLAGYSYQQNKTNNGFGVQTQNFSNDNLTYNNLFLSNPASVSQIAFDNAPISTLRLISYYGRAQYQFDDKYLVQASLRDDGSSAFGANHRYGLFPAASVGWRIINEDFMQKLPAFSDLKLRAGYGKSGNSVGFDAFSSILIYGTQTVNGASSKFLSNGNITNAIGPVRNENPDLKWESTATTNIGLDFGLFKNRITGSVDYYIKKTSDLIYDQYPVSLTQYFTNTITANAGKISNKGIEVVLSATAVKTNSFSWRTSINASHNKNVVESLSKGQFNLPSFYTAQLGGKGQSGNFSQIVQPGQPIGTFYLWHYVGKNKNGVSTYQNAAGNTIATQPLTTDQRIAGNAQPTLIYGWTNTFTYKAFDLNFLIRGVTGNKILNATLANLNNPADAKLQNIPRFTLGESFKDINAYLISDRFLESGSYLRLDNATLGYTIKPKIPAIKSVRLYLSGNNLFVITKYRGIDPEINIGGLTPGIDNNNYYPKTRTFLFGLNASF